MSSRRRHHASSPPAHGGTTATPSTPGTPTTQLVTHGRQPMTLAEARWRLALGLGQMIAAAAAPILWLGGADVVVVAGTIILACLLTAVSIARWGGFWSGR